MKNEEIKDDSYYTKPIGTFCGTKISLADESRINSQAEYPNCTDDLEEFFKEVGEYFGFI